MASLQPSRVVSSGHLWERRSSTCPRQVWRHSFGCTHDLTDPCCSCSWFTRNKRETSRNWWQSRHPSSECSYLESECYWRRLDDVPCSDIRPSNAWWPRGCNFPRQGQTFKYSMGSSLMRVHRLKSILKTRGRCSWDDCTTSIQLLSGLAVRFIACPWKAFRIQALKISRGPLIGIQTSPVIVNYTETMRKHLTALCRILEFTTFIRPLQAQPPVLKDFIECVYSFGSARYVYKKSGQDAVNGWCYLSLQLITRSKPTYRGANRRQQQYCNAAVQVLSRTSDRSCHDRCDNPVQAGKAAQFPGPVRDRQSFEHT